MVEQEPFKFRVVGSSPTGVKENHSFSLASRIQPYKVLQAAAHPHIEQGFKSILIPLKEFIRDNRDFQVIFSNATGSTFVAETIRSMDEVLLARTDASLAIAYPKPSPKERRNYSLVCMMIMKALLMLAHHSSELALDVDFEELKAVYSRYLTPIMGL